MKNSAHDLLGLPDPVGHRNNSDLPGFKNPAGLIEFLKPTGSGRPSRLVRSD